MSSPAGQPTENSNPRAATASRKACEYPPPSTRISARDRSCSGSDASAASIAAIRSAAVFAFALPGRSSPASASPVPPSPWSQNASTG
jgi:hypothetical protein